jgi:YD repeat-containing protein
VDTTLCFTPSGVWTPQAVGYKNTSLYTADIFSSAAWIPSYKDLNGPVEIKVTIPPVQIGENDSDEDSGSGDDADNQANVTYYILHSGLVDTVDIDHIAEAGNVVSLGTFDFDETEVGVVAVPTDIYTLDTQFAVADAVCWGDCELADLDLTPPTIEDAQSIVYGGELCVSAKVTDDKSLANIYLSYKGELYNMNPGSDDIFSVCAPFDAGTNLDYYIIAYDASGNEAIWNPYRGYVSRGSVPGIGIPPEARNFLRYKYMQGNRVAAAKPGHDPCSFACGDPINTQNGNLLESIDLVSLPGRPYIDLELKYNSLGSKLGIFGQSWQHDYNYHILEMDNTAVKGVFVTYPSGYVEKFEDQSGQYIPVNSGNLDTLEKSGNGFILTLQQELLQVTNAIPELTDGNGDTKTKITFDDNGDVVRIEDIYGNGLNFEYAQKAEYINFSKLSKIASDGGREVVFEYADIGPEPVNENGDFENVETEPGQGLVTKIIVSPGTSSEEIIRLEYNDSDELVKVITADGTNDEQVNQFEYQNSVITKRISPQGHAFYENTYDDKRRVTKQIAGQSFTQNYSYTQNSDGTTQTIVTDKNGATTSYNFNSAGLMTANTNELGGITKFEYNDDKRVVKEIDPEGRVTEFDYDDRGNQIYIKDALGQEVKREFNDKNQITQEVDKEGFKTIFEYDAKGNLIKLTDKLGNTKTFEYNDFGQLVKEVDFRGFETVYSYNSSGDLAEIKDAKDGLTKMEYDSRSRLTKMINPRGFETTYTYDDNDNLVQLNGPDGYTLKYQYDKNNRLIKEIDANGGEIKYEWDGSENLVKIINQLGFESSLSYGQMNELLTQIDAEGRQTKMSHNNTSGYVYKPTSITSGVTTNYGGSTESLTYNKAKVLTEVVDAEGRQTILELDPLYRLTADIKDAQGLSSKTEYQYDPTDGITSIVDANGNSTTFELDALDRVIKQTDGEGQVSSFEYDASGNLTKRVDPKGFETAYQYDELNRLVKAIDPKGQETVFEYDPNSNLTKQIDVEGRVTVYEYNSLDRLVKTVENYNENLSKNSSSSADSNIDTNLTTTYEYDLYGNLIKITNPRDQVTSFGYDASHRNISITDPKSNVTTFEYDKVGNLIKTIDRNGNPTANAYDSLNRLVSSINAENQEVKYSYDKVGNLTTVVDAKGLQTKFNYDTLNRPISMTDALGGVADLSYDKLYMSPNLAAMPDPFQKQFGANLTGYSDQNGNGYAFEYDKVYRLTKDINPESHVQSYSYDANSNLTSVTDRNGNSTSFSYDELNRIISTIDPEGGEEKYEYSQAGNLTKVIDKNGNQTSYQFDPVYRVVKVTDAEGFETKYSYDGMGNMLTLTDGNGHVTTISYDEIDRQISVTNAEGEVTKLGYDNEFSVLSKQENDGVVTKYDYDKIYNLIKVTENFVDGGSVDAQTNVDTGYGYDKNNNLTQITDPRGKATKFEYDALNRQIKEIDAEGNTWSFSYDPVGNRTKRVDAEGQVTSYTYYADNELKSTSYSNPSQFTSLNGVGGSINTSASNGFSVNYSYDPNNNRLEANSYLGQTSSNYDKLNRLVTINDSLGKQVEYSYDKVGNRLSTVYPDGQKVDYEYLKNNWLKSVTTPGTGGGQSPSTTSYERDGVGNIKKQANPNNTVALYSYDKVDRITQITNQTLGGNINSKFNYTYDGVGQRIKVDSELNWRNPSQVTTDYSYDPIRRLTKSVDSEGVFAEYSFDRNGNRLTYKTNNQQSKPISNDNSTGKPYDQYYQEYTYNDINQIVSVLEEISNSNTPQNENQNGNNGNSGQSQGNGGNKNNSNSNGGGNQTNADYGNTSQALYALLHELSAQQGKHIETQTSQNLQSQTLSLITDIETQTIIDSSEIQTKIEAIKQAIETARSNGQIDSDGIKNSLLVKLDRAIKFLDVTNDQIKNKNLKTITFDYDKNGNRVNKEFPGPNGPAIQGEDYTYDFENRLTSIQSYQGGNNGNLIDKEIRHN